MTKPALVLTCEHARNRVPKPYAALFAGRAAQAALNSHRGYDIGAAEGANHFARYFRVAPHLAASTRLLIDLNRSAHNPRRFSEFSNSLSAEEKAALMQSRYYPYRNAVIEDIRQQPGLVLHLSVHSFAPSLRGVTRNADFGLLYDPKRKREKRLCVEWQRAIRQRDARIRARRNYPYRGTTDGFTTALRRALAPSRYLGIELEVNQASMALPAQSRRDSWRLLCESLEAALDSAF